jgi:carbohydrate-selective porin OprB
VKWTGGTIFLHGKQHQELSGQAYDGVVQGYSNIDASSRTTLYEAWAQQSMFEDKLRVKAGRIDANTDFDVVATAADFLNSSMGYSPTIMEFPSYPSPQFGADVSASPGKDFKVSAGEFGTARGRILIAETAHPWTMPNHSTGRAAVGAWGLREAIARFDGKQISGTSGFYGVAEQTIWQRLLAEGSDKTQSLAGFLQIGTGDGHENPVTWHVGGGTVLGGPFRRRPADSIGAATTWVRFTDEPNGGYDAHSEQVVETYYKLNVSRTLALVTDIQYFHHPGGTWAHPDSLIATPRLVVTF